MATLPFRTDSVTVSVGLSSATDSPGMQQRGIFHGALRAGNRVHRGVVHRVDRDGDGGGVGPPAPSLAVKVKLSLPL